MASELKFFVNGKPQILQGPIDPELTLAQYLRKNLRLTGTKVGCGDGGCGSCTVTLSAVAEFGKATHAAVSACLTRVASLHGKAVTTTEGLGGAEKGEKLHPVQERLWKAHGSQCGFCSPGMVMSMSSLLREKQGVVDIEDIQGCLQGNLCRCTGYRPILEGFKTFCNDDQVNGTDGWAKSEDYEEVLKLDEGDLAPYSPTKDDPQIPYELIYMEADNKTVKLDCIDGRTWYKPNSLAQLKELMGKVKDFDLYGGGTQFKHQSFNVIQITGVREMKTIAFNEKEIKIGAAATLSNLKDNISAQMKKSNLASSQTSLLKGLHKALATLASPQVRNVATVGGHIFWGLSCLDSDLLPLFLAVGASVDILFPDGAGQTMFLRDVNLDFLPPNAVLTAVSVPVPEGEDVLTGYYRRAKRKEFSYPVANAGIQAKINGGIINSVTMAFGGTEPDYENADKRFPKLEMKLILALKGKKVKEITREILDNLVRSGMQGYDKAAGAWKEYRQAQYVDFLHKFFHGKEDSIKIKQSEKRSLLTFQKVDESQSKEDPVTRPIPNIWAAEMASGAAVYVDDMPSLSGELQLVLVQSTRPHAKVIKMDFSEALKVKGVVGVVSAEDLTKKTNRWGWIVDDDVVFSEEEVLYHGQIMAAIACEDVKIGKEALKLVKIEYEDLPAIMTIQQARDAKSVLGEPCVAKRDQGDVDVKGKRRTVKGTVHLGGQEQYYMENNGCLAVPIGEKDEMVVYSSTQEPSTVQRKIADMLELPHHKIVCKSKRAGGGFGGKQRAPATLVAALAAKKFKRPCRLMLTRKEDVAIMGHRHEMVADYEADYDSFNGKLLKVKLRMFANGGYSTDQSAGWIFMLCIRTDGGYTLKNADIEATTCKTNTVSNTAMRGFAGPEGGITIDTILSHIAHEIKIDSTKVREVNLTVDGDLPHYGETRFEGATLKQCWEECKKRSQYDKLRKEADTFNATSSDVKRGLALVPMKFAVSMCNTSFMQATAVIRVYLDGSILISHGGTEMGQGLNTKMLQVASRGLGIPLEMTHLAETSTDDVPNAICTGGSVGADLNGAAVMDACRQIKERLSPYLSNGQGWKEAVNSAFNACVNLTAVGYLPGTKVNFNPDVLSKGRITDYYTYGAACVHVEVDCVSGDVSVLLADLVVDAGRSLNPAVDLGQVEGSFLQALGYVTTEQLLTDAKTGEIVTRSPTSYKIPTVADVPKNFRVSLLTDANPNRLASAVYSSKGVGEPPFLLGASGVLMAIRDAVAAKRRELGLNDWFVLHSPATRDRLRAVANGEDDYEERRWSKDVIQI